MKWIVNATIQCEITSGNSDNFKVTMNNTTDCLFNLDFGDTFDENGPIPTVLVQAMHESDSRGRYSTVQNITKKSAEIRFWNSNGGKTNPYFTFVVFQERK